MNLYTSLGALKTGMDILLKKENVKLDRMMGHGGLFKTKGVGQRILAGAIDTPVYVMETAGEGGAWGIALLADYLVRKEEGESLTDYLANKVFHETKGTGMDPVPGMWKAMRNSWSGIQKDWRSRERQWRISDPAGRKGPPEAGIAFGPAFAWRTTQRY